MEFRKINSAEIVAVCFISAQPKNKISGLSKIPPPIPIIPERKPITIPIKIIVT
jgi:hypothetical protein